ncbi:hypothetical protein CVT25_011885 [Psilocybe cyanescens]|uniref:Uncharacterized protein n=1 Tax=Psilocybe cyanescens TaxID=93625 RepID=A0A409WIZ3_PSICY|nr:hypothetical protein CVT25_011885 [Psilocybe cyanescens]
MGAAIELDNDGNPITLNLSSEAWVLAACDAGIGSVLGVKDSMIAHILGKSGNKPCPNASAKAHKTAKTMKNRGAKRVRDESDDDNEVSEDGPAKKTRKLHTKVQKTFKQSHLKVFCGIDIPFTANQKKVVEEQFLCATISANLPFQWAEDPEVITLFLLFRSTAVNVMPSQKQISGPLLNNADKALTKRLKQFLKDQYAVMASDGWKNGSRDSINGVNLSVEGKTYLIDLILATAHKKDGESICKAFEEMIDKAEDDYGVAIVAFCCDNNGGSQRGRKDLVLKRPWLFGPPCCAHQYFTVNEEAAETAEEATNLIGWVLNHSHVHLIFNEAQQEIPPGKVLAFLVANMTRWTTHFVAFNQLFDLKDSMQRTVISSREEIISAQVGAEKNRLKKAKLEEDAVTH